MQGYSYDSLTDQMEPCEGGGYARISEAQSIIDGLTARLAEAEKMIIALRYERNFLQQALDQPGGKS